MVFKMEHSSIMVTDLEKTLAFYEKALQLTERRRKEAPDRILSFLGSDLTPQQIEVACMKQRPARYDLGDNTTHTAFRVDDIEAAKVFHKQMGCFHHELPEFGVYFIEDPDGYLSEIMPVRK